MNVVIVENSRVGLRFISGILLDLGHAVTTFRDGRDALACLQESSYTKLLMTSFELPMVSGPELCWEARLLSGEARALYVIAMSSSYDSKTLGEALDSGADDFIMKPLDQKHLAARLRAAGRTVTAQRQLIAWATRDPLTDLLNRRSFLKKAGEEFDLSVRSGLPLAGMIIDIDHFKRINDTYGHDVGDDVICHVATRVGRCGSLSVRLGGEEFGVLFEGQTLEAACGFAEDLKADISAFGIIAGMEMITVTVSIGVAVAVPGDSVSTLLKHADRALYDAKQGGRDRVVCHTCHCLSHLIKPRTTADRDGRESSSILFRCSALHYLSECPANSLAGIRRRHRMGPATLKPRRLQQNPSPVRLFMLTASLLTERPAMHDLTRRLPTSAFSYREGRLHCEGVSLDEIARSVGTPFYCYSAGRLRERYRGLVAALSPLGVAIHFAMKANGNQAVLALFAREGAGVDIVSAGELARALAAGVPAGRVIFSGVGKTAPEISAALTAGVHQLNVESFEELRLVNTIAAARGLTADVVLRINPDVDAETHAKITTGKKDNKFGIDIDLLARLDNEVKSLENVAIVGIASHIGSQIMRAAPLVATYARLLEVADSLKARGFPIARIDLGGGFGIAYQNEIELSPGEVARAIAATVANKGYALAVEPGRTLVADAGILVAGVTYVKDAGHMQFLVLDAAMNDLVRPAMYDAHHDIVPVREPAPDAAWVDYDVVGPICESSDTFAKRVPFPEAEAGDLVAFATAGAYGATMSSTYNARDLVPEILVDGNQWAVVRRRIAIEEQIGWESVPEWLLA